MSTVRISRKFGDQIGRRVVIHVHGKVFDLNAYIYIVTIPCIKWQASTKAMHGVETW